jgi:hypothetical protein
MQGKLKKPRGALLRMIRAGEKIAGYMTQADLERDAKGAGRDP